MIIPFLDAEPYIGEAIESVLAQTYEHWELILVDDGSKDGSSGVALEYASREPNRVVYLRQDPGPRGMSAARNAGLAVARGRYVAFLDADDVWLEDKLEHQLEILQAHPHAAAVLGPVECWYSWQDRALAAMDAVRGLHLAAPDTLVEPPRLVPPLLRNEVPTMTPALVRREALQRSGGFEEAFPGLYEDQVAWIKICIREPVFFASRCWYRWRQHPRASCAVAVRTGRYDDARARFLEWLARYLKDQGVADSEVWCAIGEEQARLQERSREVAVRREGLTIGRESWTMERVRAALSRWRPRWGPSKGTIGRPWQRRLGLVLLYHRIAEGEEDPWSLCVSPRHFAEHIEVLLEEAELMALSDLAKGPGRGARPAVALTFDDGYADNLHAAKPVLSRAGVPATVFIATGYLGSSRGFWWDELLRILAWGARNHRGLQLDVDGRALRLHIDSPSRLRSAYLRLYESLRIAGPDQREETLSTLRSWAGSGAAPDDRCRPLTVEELRLLAADGLIEIGAHTRTHPVLAALSTADQRIEIEGSKAELETLLSRRVRGFAYPFGQTGDFTPTTAEIVRRAGFVYACTSINGRIDATVDPFWLPRIWIRNWAGATFALKLQRWTEET